MLEHFSRMVSYLLNYTVMSQRVLSFILVWLAHKAFADKC